MTILDLSQSAILDAVRATLGAELQADVASADPGEHLDMLPNADSVRLMRTISALERRYGIELDDNEIREASTIGDLVKLVHAGAQGATFTP